MPKCAKCADMLPPNFCTPIVNTEDYMCLFCDQEISEITLKKDTGIEKYTKKQCLKDYQEFMNYMKDQTKKMSDIKDKAKTMSESGLILPGSKEFDAIIKGK